MKYALLTIPSQTKSRMEFAFIKGTTNWPPFVTKEGRENLNSPHMDSSAYLGTPKNTVGLDSIRVVLMEPLRASGAAKLTVVPEINGM